MKKLPEKYNALIDKIRGLAHEGLFHIFGSSVLAQAGALLSTVIVIRGLPKTEYGFYVSANNLYSYLAVFFGMGLANSALQYCSEHVGEGRKNAIHRYALVAGTGANLPVVLVLLLLALAKRRMGDPDVGFYLTLMAGLPFLVYLNSYLLVSLRVRLDNRGYSYSNIVFTLVTLVGNIVLTRLFGITGLIASTYLANVVGIIVCSIILQRGGYFTGLGDRAATLSGPDKKELTAYGMTCSLTNFASSILVLLDVTCLDLVLGDKAILADYKVASTIPAACSFIPACLITFFYPKLVSAFSQGRAQGRELVNKLSKLYLLVNGGVYICLALGAPVIIWLVYGKKYMNVIPIFEMLSVNYLVYSLRHLYGNVIAAIKKVRINLLFSVISGAVNIVLDLALITRFGSMGAAAATIMVTVMIGTMSFLYLRRYCRVSPGEEQ